MSELETPARASSASVADPSPTAASPRVHIKLCGFTEPEDLGRALELDIEAIGIVLAEDAKIRLSKKRVEELLRLTVGTAITPIAVVGKMDFSDCRRTADLGFEALQWVAPPEARPDHPMLSGRLGPCAVIPVLFDRPGVEVRAPLLLRPPVGPRPGLTETICIDGPRGGGRGERPNWDRAARVAQRVPLMLAGGLRPENVRTAIERVQPCAVDVSSGIETSGGRKDPEAMRAFVAAVRSVC